MTLSNCRICRHREEDGTTCPANPDYFYVHEAIENTFGEGEKERVAGKLSDCSYWEAIPKPQISALLTLSLPSWQEVTCLSLSEKQTELLEPLTQTATAIVQNHTASIDDGSETQQLASQSGHSEEITSSEGITEISEEMTSVGPVASTDSTDPSEPAESPAVDLLNEAVAVSPEPAASVDEDVVSLEAVTDAGDQVTDAEEIPARPDSAQGEDLQMTDKVAEEPAEDAVSLPEAQSEFTAETPVSSSDEDLPLTVAADADDVTSVDSDTMDDLIAPDESNAEETNQSVPQAPNVFSTLEEKITETLLDGIANQKSAAQASAAAAAATRQSLEQAIAQFWQQTSTTLGLAHQPTSDPNHENIQRGSGRIHNAPLEIR